MEKYYIVRGNRSGLFAGNIAERNGQEVKLINVRRLWYWEGACSISEIALRGVQRPENCKFTVELEEMTITDAIEIIPATKEAETNIKEVTVWEY